MITHEALKALLEDLKSVQNKEGDYLAALDSAVETVEVWAETEPKQYGWHGWESEEEATEGEARKGVYFITITDPYGDEYAIIVHRVVEGYPLDGEEAKRKERNAQAIVDALNETL